MRKPVCDEQLEYDWNILMRIAPVHKQGSKTFTALRTVCWPRVYRLNSSQPPPEARSMLALPHTHLTPSAIRHRNSACEKLFQSHPVLCPSQIKKEKTGVHNVSTTPYALIVNNVVHINVLHRARELHVQLGT